MKWLALILVASALAGCTTASGPAAQSAPPQPASAIGEVPPAKQAVPGEGEVCLKPEDKTGIRFELYKPQGDSTYRAQAGWVVARPSFQLLGAVKFPRPVDPASVKISVQPAVNWVQQPQSGQGIPADLFLFNFLPAGGNPNQPLMMQWGKPGWITLTVEAAKDKEGKPLLEQPAALKIFAYDDTMQAAYPYLASCYSSLGVSPGPNGP